MASKNVQEDMQSFDRLRAQLLTVSSQKQQIEFQSAMLKDALKQLKESNEKKVFKAAGNIMILTDKNTVEKDLQKQQEEFDIRVESLKKQESSLIDRLNKLKTSIEEASKPKEEVKEEKKKTS